MLDRVAGKGLIAFKDTGGKQKVYWADQSQFPVLSEEERTTLQRSIESIEDDLLAKKADLSSLEHRLSSVSLFFFVCISSSFDSRWNPSRI